MRQLSRFISLALVVLPAVTFAGDLQEQAQQSTLTFTKFILAVLTLLILWGVAFVPMLIGVYFGISEYRKISKQEKERNQDYNLFEKLGKPTAIIVFFTLISLVWIKMVALAIEGFDSMLADTVKKFVQVALG